MSPTPTTVWPTHPAQLGAHPANSSSNQSLTTAPGEEGSSSRVIKSASLVRVDGRAANGVFDPFLGAGLELLNSPELFGVDFTADFGA